MSEQLMMMMMMTMVVLSATDDFVLVCARLGQLTLTVKILMSMITFSVVLVLATALLPFFFSYFLQLIWTRSDPYNDLRNSRKKKQKKEKYCGGGVMVTGVGFLVAHEKRATKTPQSFVHHQQYYRTESPICLVFGA